MRAESATQARQTWKGAAAFAAPVIARLALTDRHLQCRQDQLGAQVRLHRPADDPTAERIEHDSEIQEAGSRRDIGDVGDPKLVGAVGGEIPVHQVRRRARVAVPPGGDDATAAADADNPCRPHQPGNPLFADCPTFGTQLGMNSRCTVGAARDGMDRATPVRELNPPTRDGEALPRRAICDNVVYRLIQISKVPLSIFGFLLMEIAPETILVACTISANAFAADASASAP